MSENQNQSEPDTKQNSKPEPEPENKTEQEKKPETKKEKTKQIPKEKPQTEQEPKQEPFKVNCTVCDLELKSDTSQQRAQELLQIHMLEHSKSKSEATEKQTKTPIGLSSNATIAIFAVLIGLGALYGLMHYHGKKKLSDDEKEKGK